MIASLALSCLGACQAGADKTDSANITDSADKTDWASEAREALKGTKSFKHSNMNLSFDYPANWNQEESEPPILFKMRAPTRNASINGSGESAPDLNHLTLAQAVEDLYAENPELYFKKLSQEEITIGGTTKAVKRIYTTGDSPKKAKQLSLFWVKDGNGYTINCTTKEHGFAQYEPVFNKIIKSIKL